LNALFSIAHSQRTVVSPIMGVQIAGLHSCVLEDGTVDCLFDIDGDSDNNILQFRFPLPQLVTEEELSAFALWLMIPIDLTTVTRH
jgi:hypothetical protein